MSLKTLVGFDNRVSSVIWSKDVPDFEGRIHELTKNSVPLTQVYRLINATFLNDNEYWLDKINKVLHIKLPSPQDANSYQILATIYFTFFGRWDTKANISNGSLNQIFTINQNTLLKYVRIPLMLMGSGTITGLKMQIRAVRGTTITEKVLAESENMDVANDLASKANTLLFTYFKFTEYGLKAGVDYALVLQYTTPTEFSDSFHLAWSQIDPVYLTGLPTDESIISLGGYHFAIVGAKI
jgi:hypothetical protein